MIQTVGITRPFCDLLWGFPEPKKTSDGGEKPLSVLVSKFSHVFYVKNPCFLGYIHMFHDEFLPLFFSVQNIPISENVHTNTVIHHDPSLWNYVDKFKR